MARQAKIQIFQGATGKPTRDYLQLVLGRLVGRYQTLIVPNVGRFMVPQLARAAGWPAERIQTSDTSIFSSVVGYAAERGSIDELEIGFSDELAFLEQYRGTAKFPAAVLYGIKWAQYRAGTTYYAEQFREELESDRDGYVHALHVQLMGLRASLGPIAYRIADPLSELGAAKNDATAVVYADPADYTKVMQPIGEHVLWNGAGAAQGSASTALYDYAQSAGPLLIWSRARDISEAEQPYVTFGHELKAGQVEYTLISRPDEVDNAAMPRRVTEVNSGGWPLFMPEQVITESDRIQTAMVTREVALYYRELWAHKLGTVRAERYVVLLINGRIWGSIGMNLSDAMSRRPTSTGTNVFELYGFNAPSRYKRLNTLLMLCLTCEQFLADLISSEPLLAWCGEVGFSTTCISDVPELKANRGILKLTGRSRLPNGKYKLLYNTKFHPGSYSDMVRKWLAKDGKLLWD